MLWQCFQGLYRFYRMITIVSTQLNLISVHERQQPGSGDVSLCDSTLLLLLSRVSEFLKYFICSWQWVSICYLIALSVSSDRVEQKSHLCLSLSLNSAGLKQNVFLYVQIDQNNHQNISLYIWLTQNTRQQQHV